MKRTTLIFIALVAPTAASAGCIGPVIMGECKGTVTPFETLQPNAYGQGVHQNRYGQPVTLEPKGGGVRGEMLQIRPDAYGPGIHMDQYGRPVREKPWP